MSKVGGSGCGCSSGGLLSGGSGYSFNLNSSPMALGPNSGYGAIDPYKPGVTTGSTSALAYPPLQSMLGGRKSKKARSSKFRRSKSVHSKSMRLRLKSKSKSKSNKSVRSKSKDTRRRKQMRRKSRRGGQKGGELAFSEYSAAAASPVVANTEAVSQIASSPMYGVNLSPLDPKMSALANPVIPERKDGCGK